MSNKLTRLQRLAKYIKHDFREIVWPSSLPNPPDYVKPKGFFDYSLAEHFKLFQEVFRLYTQTWTGGKLYDDLRRAEGNDPEEQGKDEKSKEPTMLEDLAVASRLGVEGLRPALQKIYMTRATAYRDALKNFVEGYQEGLAKAMASDSSQDEDTSKEDKKAS